MCFPAQLQSNLTQRKSKLLTEGVNSKPANLASPPDAFPIQIVSLAFQTFEATLHLMRDI